MYIFLQPYNNIECIWILLMVGMARLGKQRWVVISDNFSSVHVSKMVVIPPQCIYQSNILLTIAPILSYYHFSSCYSVFPFQILFPNLIYGNFVEIGFMKCFTDCVSLMIILLSNQRINFFKWISLNYYMNWFNRFVILNPARIRFKFKSWN